MYKNQENYQKRFKGRYVICIEENENGTIDVYSTDSVFWRDFFKNKKNIGDIENENRHS